jgi:hypothetical protein
VENICKCTGHNGKAHSNVLAQPWRLVLGRVSDLGTFGCLLTGIWFLAQQPPETVQYLDPILQDLHYERRKAYFLYGKVDESIIEVDLDLVAGYSPRAAPLRLSMPCNGLVNVFL